MNQNGTVTEIIRKYFEIVKEDEINKTIQYLSKSLKKNI